MGKVYKLDEKRVIKRIPKEIYCSEEYDNLIKILHPNIIHPIDISYNSDYVDIILPYHGKPPEKLTVNIKEKLRNLIETLDFMHNSNIYHRDIRTQNLLEHNEKIIYIDFGLSLYSTKSSTAGKIDTCIPFRAPELSLEDLVDLRKVDVYALGMTFLEIILGIYLSRDILKITMSDYLHFPRQIQHFIFLSSHRVNLPVLQQYENITYPLLNLIHQISDPLLQNLVFIMTSFNHKQRPIPAQCLSHPFFTNE